jgi:hypothetical protein
LSLKLKNSIFLKLFGEKKSVAILKNYYNFYDFARRWKVSRFMLLK